jgi:DNA-binding transcriptional MocR family regulator
LFAREPFGMVARTVKNRRHASAILYVQVADKIAALIESGTLRPGERIPSVRRASKQHGVSVTTILEAYLALENRELIEARPKSGFFVRARLRHAVPEPEPSRASRLPAKVGVTSLLSCIFDSARNPGIVPFGAAYPAAEALPAEKLSRITAAIARRNSARAAAYEMPPGNERLRRGIARRLLEAGAVVTADDLIVTCGGTEALALSLQAVAKRGDVVAVESPTYFGVLQLMEELGLRALEIPMHPRLGMDLDALERAMRRTKIAACLAIPNFSNPLGSLMPEEHKRRLVELLAARETPLIEDDINGELAHDGSRPRVAQSYDRAGLVLLCGSISKTLAPGYRVGWVVPGRFHERVKALKHIHTLATASLPQMAVAEFLANGGYDHHLRGLRQRMAEQVARVSEAVGAAFPPGVRISRPAGGFVLWVELPGSGSALELHRRALAAGISIAPGPMFSAQQGFQNFIRINCGNPWTARSAEAIGQLGKLVEKR